MSKKTELPYRVHTPHGIEVAAFEHPPLAAHVLSAMGPGSKLYHSDFPGRPLWTEGGTDRQASAPAASCLKYFFMTCMSELRRISEGSNSTKEFPERVKFNATFDDAILIDKIAKFAYSENPQAWRSELECLMDITATHANGCPLDLEVMARNLGSYDFFHDVLGIANNINRETGKLDNGFVPRFALGVAR